MILNQLELKLIGPVLAMLEANEDMHIELSLTVTDVRRVRMEAMTSGIIIKEFQTDAPPSVEFYSKPMGLAMAYKFKRLEDLLHPPM